MAGSRCKRNVDPSSFSTVVASRSSRCRCPSHRLLHPPRRHLLPSRHRPSSLMHAICLSSHVSTTHPPFSYAPYHVRTVDPPGEVVGHVRRQSCVVWVFPVQSRRLDGCTRLVAGQKTAHWQSGSWVCSLRLVANVQERSAKCGRCCWRLRPSRDRDGWWGWNGRRPEKESRRDAFCQRQRQSVTSGAGAVLVVEAVYGGVRGRDAAGARGQAWESPVSAAGKGS